MSLHNPNRRTFALLFGAVLASSLALSACQVRPLYSAGSSASGGAAPSHLSVSVNEVNTRYAQQVRNHVIFLMNGGAAEPAEPAYRLDLGVTRREILSANVQVQANGENQPSAGAIVLTSNYVLSDAASGAQVSAGSRTITASFDRSRQQFALLRAQKDAEDRAARELAELVHLAVAGALAK